MSKIQIELDKSELDTLEKVSEITCRDYDIRYGFISVENLLEALEDLMCDYNSLKDDYETLENGKSI